MELSLLSDDLPTPDVANTAAVVITHYPDESFDRRVENLSNQFAEVFWVDNTPTADAGKQRQHSSRVHYLPRGTNTGLGCALNYGCNAALAAGFVWVVTFDQDSDVTDNFLPQQIASWSDAEKPVFILGCNYADSGSVNAPRFKESNEVVPCTTVITSGCMMSLSLLKNLGGFRDDYFIDGIDHEICLRGRASGLLVARHGTVLMKHQIGERSSNYRIFPYLHSPVRKYYGMRNGVRNIVQYATGEPVWAARKIASLAWEIVVSLLFEPDKRRKSRAIFCGLRDGFAGRMGIAPEDLT